MSKKEEEKGEQDKVRHNAFLDDFEKSQLGLIEDRAATLEGLKREGSRWKNQKELTRPIICIVYINTAIDFFETFGYPAAGVSHLDLDVIQNYEDGMRYAMGGMTSGIRAAQGKAEDDVDTFATILGHRPKIRDVTYMAGEVLQEDFSGFALAKRIEGEVVDGRVPILKRIKSPSSFKRGVCFGLKMYRELYPLTAGLIES